MGNLKGTLGSAKINVVENVIPDWNQNDPNAKDYVKNRPGGYDIPPTVDISWDGDMTGKEKIQISEGLYYVKVANEAPPFDSFKGNKAIVESEILYDDGTSEIDSSEMTVKLVVPGDYYFVGQAIAGVLSDYADVISGMTFSKGLWLMCSVG